VRSLVVATLLLCITGLPGCLEWSQDSQGNLQSVGLPGVPVWQSSAPPPPVSPSTLGYTQEEAAKMSGPVLVMPTTAGPYRYRFYQTGENHCAEDLAKLLTERANNTYVNGPAPYCTNQPTMPPAQKSGGAFGF
jgi:hypothetical protein